MPIVWRTNNAWREAALGSVRLPGTACGAPNATAGGQRALGKVVCGEIPTARTGTAYKVKWTDEAAVDVDWKTDMTLQHFEVILIMSINK